MAEREERIESGRAQPPDTLWGVDRELALTALRMLAYFSIFVVATMLVMPFGLRLAIQELTAGVSAALIRVFGITVTREGTSLLLPGITLIIDWACTAVTILSLYVSLILAYRTTLAIKALGIGVGAVVILVANQLRILATAIAAQYWLAGLHVLHDYLFQISMVVVAVGLWMWWLGLVSRSEGSNV